MEETGGDCGEGAAPRVAGDEERRAGVLAERRLDLAADRLVGGEEPRVDASPPPSDGGERHPEVGLPVPGFFSVPRKASTIISRSPVG